MNFKSALDSKATTTISLMRNCAGSAPMVRSCANPVRVDALPISATPPPMAIIEAEAKKYLGRIDELGGMVNAIEQGYPQREIQNSAYAYQVEIEKKHSKTIGAMTFR